MTSTSATVARCAPHLGRRAGLLVLAGLLAWTTSAAGQDKPAVQVKPPAPALTPPVAQSSTDVPYPPGANGDAVVLLELTIETDGTVSNAVVIDGVEPFAEQARRSVLAWRFLPARRGSTPVAARIRARVEFHQEQAPSTPPPTGQPPPAARGAPATPPAPPTSNVVLEVPEDVEVRGVRHEIGETTLSATDVREMPGAFGDPFRAIEALPGVTPVVSGLPFFYIRGAPPNDNAYFVDGIRVPLLFHVGIGEGVIHPALIDHVDFYPGAAPAAYGGSAGAVIDGQTRDPAATPHGEANVRLIDAGALVESPLGDGRGSALVAGRYGYPGPILSAITPTVQPGLLGLPGARDLAGRRSRHAWRLRVREPRLPRLGQHHQRSDGPDRRAARLRLSPGRPALRPGARRRPPARSRRRSATTSKEARAGATGRPSPASPTSRPPFVWRPRRSSRRRCACGAARTCALDDYGFAQGQAPTDPNGSPQPQVPASETADPPPTNITGGAHADVVWRVAPRVEIVPGVRVDLFESTRANGPSGANATTTVPAFDPRLSTRVTVTPAVAWLSAFGLSHQYPALRVGAFPAMLLSVPGLSRSATRSFRPSRRPVRGWRSLCPRTSRSRRRGSCRGGRASPT